MRSSVPGFNSFDLRSADHWKLLLGKFDAADVVWIGDTYDSGKPEHARHFRTAGEWLKADGAVAEVPGVW